MSSTRIRGRILKRDGEECIFCGEEQKITEVEDGYVVKDGFTIPRTKKKSNLRVHHIRPISKGGTDLPENMITLCQSCHKKEHQRMRGEQDSWGERELEYLKKPIKLELDLTQLARDLENRCERGVEERHLKFMMKQVYSEIAERKYQHILNKELEDKIIKDRVNTLDIMQIINGHSDRMDGLMELLKAMTGNLNKVTNTVENGSKVQNQIIRMFDNYVRKPDGEEDKKPEPVKELNEHDLFMYA